MQMNWNKLLNQDRVRPSKSPGDDRTAFQHDYDRAVFSTPVKRLQDKAQVFPLDPSDAVRTRLTHSLEVSSVARGLAGSAAAWMVKQKEIGGQMAGQIETIAATCGLLHDLGNPPFGHAGEEAIRSWFEKMYPQRLLEGLDAQQTADFMAFEGNAQTIRLVAKLQILADFNGLNLTYGTLSALIKYTAKSDDVGGKSQDRARKKFGYFASETDLVGTVRNETGTGNARNPICYLVEAADDIVYLAADAEDAVKKRIISWGDVKGALKGRKGGHPDPTVGGAFDRMGKILAPADGADGAEAKLDDDTEAAAFRTAAIGVMFESAREEFEKHYSEIMSGNFKGTLLPEGLDLAVRLRSLEKEMVYPTRSTITLELMGRRVIGELMDVLWEGAQSVPKEDRPRKTSSFAEKSAALLSPNYLKVFRHAAEEGRLPERYLRLQLLTDYICGMTDSFAKRLHAELFNGC